MGNKIQLALNVKDVDEATEFYSQMFNTKPNKIKEGYTNFIVEDPPLKLVLFENPNADSSLNHLGVEMSSAEAVKVKTEELQSSNLETRVSTQESCCHAVQDKVWVSAPDVPLGAWEFYTVLEDVENKITNTGCCPKNNSTVEVNKPGCC